MFSSLFPRLNKSALRLISKWNSIYWFRNSNSKVPSCIPLSNKLQMESSLPCLWPLKHSTAFTLWLCYSVVLPTPYDSRLDYYGPTLLTLLTFLYSVSTIATSQHFFLYSTFFFFFFTNSTIKAVLDTSISTSELVPTWPLILFLWSSFYSSLFHHKSSSHHPYWNLRDNNYEVPVKKDINVKLLFRMKKVKSKFCFVMVRTHLFLFVCLLVNVVHGKT